MLPLRHKPVSIQPFMHQSIPILSPGSGISPAIKNKEINLFLLGTAENLKRPTCPGRGAFAGLFSKYPYDRGSAGGALGERTDSLLELNDAAYKLKVYCTTYMYKLNLK